MKINIQTEHELKFIVCAHWATEGGMDSDYFGNEVNSLEDAIHLIQLAKAKNSARDWVIECTVETKTKRVA